MDWGTQMMKKVFIVVLEIVSFLVLYIPSFAADIPAQAQTVKDHGNYEGDQLTFSVNVAARFGNSSTAVVCIPAKTKLRGLPPVTDGSLNVTVEDKLPFWRHGFWGTIWRKIAFARDDSKDKEFDTKLREKKAKRSLVFSQYSGCNPDTILLANRKGKPLSRVALSGDAVLNIPKATIDQTPPNRSGLCYGALLVPYKYHFTGSKEFNTNTTVAPYMGYRIDKETLGRSLELILFTGAADISVPQTTNGQTTTQTLAGFSYGGGIIGKLKDSFQYGIVIGADRVSANANYNDNGKPWIAIEIGYSFSQ
jgi:hypothetical protein